MRNYKEQIEQYGINVLKLTENQLQEFAEDILPAVQDLLSVSASMVNTSVNAVGISMLAVKYENPTRYLCMELLIINSEQKNYREIEIGHGEVFTEEDYNKVIEAVKNEKQKEL